MIFLCPDIGIDKLSASFLAVASSLVAAAAIFTEIRCNFVPLFLSVMFA